MSGAVVARARRCLGTAFRGHGRRPGEALDCVGLAAFALAVPDPPGGYALRGGGAAGAAAAIGAAGLAPVRDGGLPGDLLLLATGPHQLHLAIASAAGFIHADAGLGRVVEVPGPPPWPVIGRFRRATRRAGGG
ncbi:peptidoglycan endopeptidase [Sphingomonas morindae]|uniref:Peptidoglycan endopeptidase n=1 Tax=Sphingomonas morindae TaxID=1541170 RepID=A0ABY4X3L6_9SPHN|nr:peptidoglycan endopeptidase [Sphingomonas morindae]USI71478.1 peptidoglycan endopeptidase [Sphingomonas morindae]